MKTDPLEEAVRLVLASQWQRGNADLRGAGDATAKPGPTVLLCEPYPGDPTREVVLLRASFSPGDATPAHHHPGWVVGYVLSGEYEFQLEGQPRQRLVAGDCFYEPPDSTHIVSHNPGDTTTEVLAFLVRERGAPNMIPLEGSKESRANGP